MADIKHKCSVEDCNRDSTARGLCLMHYKRARTAGTLPEKTVLRCSVDGCARKYTSAGYCDMHRSRFRRHGDPLLTKTAPEGDGLALLQSLVGHDGDECITWPFSTNPQGYGQTYYCGEVMGAHRVMCILEHGAPPTPEHQAAHWCGRGRDGCINPKHLRWATAKENIADKFNLHGWRLVHDQNGRLIGHARD